MNESLYKLREENRKLKEENEKNKKIINNCNSRLNEIEKEVQIKINQALNQIKN